MKKSCSEVALGSTLAALWLLAGLAGCHRDSTSADQSLLVRIEVLAAVDCIRLQVQSLDEGVLQIQEIEKAVRPRAGAPGEIRAAVFRGAGLGPTVSLVASGHRGACNSKAVASSDQVSASFLVGEVPDCSKDRGCVSLRLAVMGVDADGDGYEVGADCDDADSSIYPGAPENCAGAVDMNCDGKVACQDATCLGQACDDGSLCTSGETCQTGGSCGAPVSTLTCAPSDGCHVAGLCDPGTGLCSNPAKADGASCDDGDACTRTDQCQQGVCKGSNAVVCAPLDSCHVAGNCAPSTGVCSDPAKPNGALCDDGNACTRSDQCQGAVCVGSNPVLCTAQDQCHDAGICNSATGFCSNPRKADGTPCNDGSVCTQVDSCQAGTCMGSSPVVCTALDQCHLAGTCDPVAGCSNPVAPTGTCCPLINGVGFACDGAGSCNRNLTGVAEICSDAIDNNCDGLIDCADPICDRKACDAIKPSMFCCGSTCTDISTDGNCGGCGFTCNNGNTCQPVVINLKTVSGQCSCNILSGNADCPSGLDANQSCNALASRCGCVTSNNACRNAANTTSLCIQLTGPDYCVYP